MGLAQDRLTVFLNTFNQVRTDLTLRVNDVARDQLFNHIVYQQIIEQVDNIMLLIDTELVAKEANIKEVKYDDIKRPVRPREIIPIDTKPQTAQAEIKV